MYKIIKIFVIFFLCCSLKAYSYTVFDAPRDSFLDYVRKEDEMTEKKQEALDAQIQLDLQIENIELDLVECLEIALENNYNLKIANRAKNYAEWDYNSKKAEFLPDVAGNFRFSQLRGTFLVGGVAPDLVKEYAVFMSVIAEYNALSNNKIFYETKIKKLLKKAAVSQNNFTKDEVILNTVLAYYELLGRKLSIDVLHTNLLDRKEQLRSMQARYEIGLGEKFDVLRAEAQYQLAIKELVAELNNLRFAQSNLARIMGLDVLAPVYPKDSTIKQIKLYDGDYDIEYLYQQALMLRNDIRTKELELKAQKVDRNSNWADFIPQLYFYYQYSDSGVISSGIRFGDILSAELRLPVGENLGVKTYAEYKKANEEYQKALLEFAKYKREIKENIMKSVYNTSAALEKIRASEKEVAAAKLSLDMSLVRLDVGQATFLDVLEAQSTKTQARQGLIYNVIEYNCAQVQLLFDAGLITVGDIIEKYLEQE